MPMSRDKRTNDNLMYSNNIMSYRNELMGRLLSGITNSELENLIRVREEGRRPIPAPRRKKQQPVAAPRTKINEKRRALNGYTKSYEIGLKSNVNALVQLQNTRLAISRYCLILFLRRQKGSNLWKLLWLPLSNGPDKKERTKTQ